MPPPPTPGTRHPRKRRHLDWELIACGVRGHVLVDAAGAPDHIPPDALVRELAGVGFHRCLRCDAWAPLPPGAAAARRFPSEDELPLRGKALHDRVLLRLIALDRVLHFLVLGLLGIAVLAFASHRAVLHDAFYRVVTALQGGVGGGPVSTHSHVGIIHDLDRLFTLSRGTLVEVGISLLAYGTLEGVEAIGLWLGRRWAEYLTFIATVVLLPLEIYELTESVSALKLIGFLINLVVVAYLLYSKRLFGLRGGGAVEQAEREHDTGWPAIKRATPSAPAP